MTIEAARAVADAVLYEGYLLYPYRASSTKNRSRWQFGVLGPPHASASAFAEAPNMAMQCLVTPGGHVTVRLRFLHLQVRDVERPPPPGLIPSAAAVAADEAVEHEVTLPPFTGPPLDFPVTVPAFSSVEPGAGRRWPLTARVRVHATGDGDLLRLTVTVTNEHPDPVADKASATRHSLLGAHLLLEATGASFVSVVDPPPPFAAAAGRCHQDRCWPVLAGSNALLLGAPIILYDHPQIAAESPGPLFDLTEIDEILTLRVMTMTDAEKAEARATDPRAAAIIDRCDAMTPAELARLRGTRRNPSPARPPAPASSAVSSAVSLPDPAAVPSFGETPWWDPAADASVDPAHDTVDVAGTPVGKDSLVRLRPSRRADAQDLFLAGRLARVTAVLSDVDGGSHVAVVLADDPDSDLHDWYGRYYYFAPDELEPAGAATGGENPS